MMMMNIIIIIRRGVITHAGVMILNTIAYRCKGIHELNI